MEPEANKGISAAKPPRVLLTGASGFVGIPCLELLARRGWEVVAVSSRRQAQRHPKVRWLKADLLEPGEARGVIQEVRPNHLLHLAWSASAPHWATHKDNYRWVRSSLELLQSFAEQGGKRAVFAGTCAEYDWSHGCCSEAETPLRAATTYGLAKRTLGELFVDYVGREDSSLSGAWARLFFLFGPHEAPRRLLPSVINSLLRGEEAHCTHGRQLRDYMFVEDAAEALVTLLEGGVQGAINLASGEAIPLAEVIHKAAERLGGWERVRLGSLATPENDPPLVVADITRQTKELGWRPKWTIDAAIDQSIEWWRARQKGSSRA